MSVTDGTPVPQLENSLRPDLEEYIKHSEAALRDRNMAGPVRLRDAVRYALRLEAALREINEGLKDWIGEHKNTKTDWDSMAVDPIVIVQGISERVLGVRK